MITTALAVGSGGVINLGNGPTYGILLAILFVHGIVCSAATSVLARLNIFYVLVNGMVSFSIHVIELLCKSKVQSVQLSGQS